MPSAKTKGKSLAGLLGKKQEPAEDSGQTAAQKLKAGLSLPFVLAPPVEDGPPSAGGGAEQGTQATSEQGDAPAQEPQPAAEHQPAGSAQQGHTEEGQQQQQQHAHSIPASTQGEGFKGEGGDSEHDGLVPGTEVGLPVMDYVPISINEMKRVARKKGKEGKQPGEKGQGFISSQMSKKKDREALKRKYIMGLEGGEDDGGKGPMARKRRAGGAHGSSLAAGDGGSEDSEGSSSGSDDDGGDGGAGATGSNRRGRGSSSSRRGSSGGAGDEKESDSESGDGNEGEGDGQLSHVVPFDYVAVHQQENAAKRTRSAKEQARAQQAEEKGGRGGRGGRGGANGRGRGRQQRGRGGRPAFNPYHIPDENLVKAGKRSAVMPRSGNRTLTFK